MAASPTSGTDRSHVRRAAVAQITSTADRDLNFAQCAAAARAAAAAGALMLFLPECFDFIGSASEETVRGAESIEASLQSGRLALYRDLAKETSLWLSLGGFHAISDTPGKVWNAHLVLDSSGALQACYKKMHLFDVDVPGGPSYRESSFTAPGSELVSVDTPVGRLGLSTCYDLRFPELYAALARPPHSCDVVAIPAAFMRPTGRAHWEILNRARAIECQVYVLSAAQSGWHHASRASHGHALAVDFWGALIGDAGPGEEKAAAASAVPNIVLCDIDRDAMLHARARMPLALHRRADVFLQDARSS